MNKEHFSYVLRHSNIIEKLAGKNVIDISSGNYVDLIKEIAKEKNVQDFKVYTAANFSTACFDFTSEKCFNDLLQFLHTSYTIDIPIYIVCFAVFGDNNVELQKKFMRNLSRLMHDDNINIKLCYFLTANCHCTDIDNCSHDNGYLLKEEMFEYFGLVTVGCTPLMVPFKHAAISDCATDYAVESLRSFLSPQLFKMVMAQLTHRKYASSIMYTLAPFMLGYTDMPIEHTFKHEKNIYGSQA